MRTPTSACCRGQWQHSCKLRIHISKCGSGYRKNTTSTSCRGSRPSWALVGAGCCNQLQFAQGQYPYLALLLPALGCCILVVVFPLPTRHLLSAHIAHEHILQLALCGGGYNYTYIIIYIHSSQPETLRLCNCFQCVRQF